jgi:glycosyltransferase involved in cell wall biosynthesis
MNRIGINTLFLIPNEVGGTEYYTRSFLNELQKQDRKNEYVVFCNRENFETFKFSNPLWKKVLCDISARNRFARIVFEQVILPFYILRHGCKTVHSFGYIGPFFLPARSIITVHDANWKDHPEDTPWLPRLTTSILMELSLFSAHRIITDSAFSLTRLVAHYPQYRSKLSMVEPGLDEHFLELLRTKQSKPSEVQKPYFLCVSGLYPHKRVSYLLELWQHLQQDVPNYSLVIVGKNGGEVTKIREMAQNAKRVVILDKVTLPKLVSLYQNAEEFLFPSVYEGFGFPVYEALAAGLPTMVGNKSCYSLEAQKFLSEFSFEPSKDSKKVVKLMGKDQKPYAAAGYVAATKKLLSFYQEA